MKLTRRGFLKTASLAAATTAFVPSVALGRGKERTLLILHTNDLHCHFEAQPENHPVNAGKGGLHRISAYVKALRKTCPDLLLFDSGDFSQGTPYFNFFGAEVILKLMSEMGYSASTVGNHEFDNGLQQLSLALHHARFPLINSNYDFSETPLSGKIDRHRVFEQNGLRVGVYGLGVELDGLVDPAKSGATRYLDPLETAWEEEAYLRREEKCDLIVCLSHLGYSYSEPDRISDVLLASRTHFTDVILGGHTHTFLKQPQQFRNKRKKEVVVNQAGWAALQMGRLEFVFEQRQTFFLMPHPNHDFTRS
ncbi:MAG TPA: metallophosphatase [Prolixibacteraceae bacterium]|nr:metallophosphatase [Prolixibacteraceae bacterium]